MESAIYESATFRCCMQPRNRVGMEFWVELALEMARWHEVWCLTSSSNRSAIEAGLKEQRGIKLHFVYCDESDNEKSWLMHSKWVGDTLLVWARYYAWQWASYQIARKLHEKIHFDLTHHVTIASWRVPKLPLEVRYSSCMGTCGWRAGNPYWLP